MMIPYILFVVVFSCWIKCYNEVTEFLLDGLITKRVYKLIVFSCTEISKVER